MKALAPPYPIETHLPFMPRPTILLLYTSSPSRANYGYTTFAQPWNVPIKGSPRSA